MYFRQTMPWRVPAITVDPRGPAWVVGSCEESRHEEAGLDRRRCCHHAAGLLLALQGTGVMSGASMSNDAFWAVTAPVIAIAGFGLAGLGVRGRPS